MVVMTTNYTATFIQVAPDCPVASAQIPPARGSAPTIAQRQYDLLIEAPYSMTSDELLFAIHAERQEIPESERAAGFETFVATPQACLRASPLAKRFGWGFHHDEHGKVALVPLGSAEYRAFATDDSLTQRPAMRSKRG